jgi:tetratricopeptide (TPR) repeat protein
MSVKVKDIKERLEGSYRLIRIKKIKIKFFAIQIIIGILIGLVVAFFMGMGLDPFYFPLDTFAFLLFIFLLIIAGEAIYFKSLEIRYTRSRSRKFLIARNSVRRSGVIIGLAIFCLILLILPITDETIAEWYRPAYDGSNGNGEPILVGYPGEFSFESQDYIGFTRADRLTVTINPNNSPSDQVPLSVYKMRNSQIELITPGSVSSSSAFITQNVGSHSYVFDTFYVNLDPPDNGMYYYSWSVESRTSPLLTLYYPIVAILFIIIEGVSLGIMYPIRQKHASASIYSKKYVAEAKSSEYFAEERAVPMTQEEAKEEAMLESTLDIELPPPPPTKPVPTAATPSPPEEKEMVRKLGEVDEGIIKEPDIACPNCGEMNSPHAVMCFVCGNPLDVSKEVAKIDLIDYLRKGKEFAEAGKHVDALQCFEEVLKQDKANEEALLEKGMILRRQGKWGMAIQHINTALQINPRNTQALLEKAEILTERDKTDKALGLYKQILYNDPHNMYVKSKIDELTEDAELEDAEDVIDLFMCVPGIGLARATALYEAGYTTFAQLKEASEADLAKVKGISERLAKKIKKSLEGME